MTDWYAIARRISLVSFVLLAFWGVYQAYSQILFWLDASWQQYLYVMFWPITNAPVWYKFALFGLGFWLLLPYIMVRESSR